jgi:hypothetical protein
MAKKKHVPDGTWAKTSDGQFCTVDECRIETYPEGVSFKEGTVTLRWHPANPHAFEVLGARWGEGDFWARASIKGVAFFFETIANRKSQGEGTPCE